MYCKVECLREAGDRSPVIFIHGFPDSPLMFAEYYRESERAQPWLEGRRIYTIAFPNRFTNPNYPSYGALVNETISHEFDTLLKERIAASPTGKVILIAHDWGATRSWAFVRRYGSDGIEKMVALSVASSFRFDVFEHGLRALGWTYSTLFGSAWHIPIPAYRRFVTSLIVKYGGYHSTQNDTLYKDAYHYWYGPWRPFLAIVDFFGLRIRPAFTDFKFPVLFIRSPMDRLPTTRGFEKAIQARPNCKMLILEGANHWFPEQHADKVLKEIRAFI